MNHRSVVRDLQGTVRPIRLIIAALLVAVRTGAEPSALPVGTAKLHAFQFR